jgi:hypothetical protein
MWCYESMCLLNPAVLPAVGCQDSVSGYQSISQQLARDYNIHAAAVLQAGAPAEAGAAGAGGRGGGSAAADKIKVATADASEEEVHRMYQNMGERLAVSGDESRNTVVGVSPGSP